MDREFDPEFFHFMRELAANNDREWVAAHKARYEADVLEPSLAFIEDFGYRLREISPNFVADPRRTGGSLFRIYRDVRFSHDKRPYKDHFGAYVAEGGRKSILPGYYLHLAANNNSFLAGGLWMPPADYLKAVRQEIDYNLDGLERIIQAPDFKNRLGSIQGEQLKTTPKGYEKDNPAIEYLRFKSWNATMPLPDKVVLSKDFMHALLDGFKAVKPFNDFLTTPLRDIGEE